MNMVIVIIILFITVINTVVRGWSDVKSWLEQGALCSGS